MCAIKLHVLLTTLMWGLAGQVGVQSQNVNSIHKADVEPAVLVVGAGIAGLSAALEAANLGAHVTIVEMGSVFGGASILSGGNVSIVATSFQQKRGVHDTPEVAFRDFMAWGEDANQEWVRYYVNHSAVEVYDWLVNLGVKFDGLAQPQGNSVPRGHCVPGRGVGLVVPIFQACVRHPRLHFAWNTKAKELLREDGQVVGLSVEDLRVGVTKHLRAEAVILATGGFQGNLALVRQHWPADLPLPQRILTGTGIHSVGGGHELAWQAGAASQNLDHQWNYALGLPDWRDPKGERGLYVKPEAAIWVNAQGQRFVNETESPKITFPALVRQHPAYYWAIFDERGKRSIFVAGSDFTHFNVVEKTILKSPELTKTAPSLAELAAVTGLPPTALFETIRGFNAMVDQGEDTAFGRFSKKQRRGSVIPRIEQPPFYAMQIFPLARKNMGGLRIDLQARVLDQQQQPIPGLYAAGELTGMGSINGKAALEGTFLGPGVATGRVAGRSAVAGVKQQPRRMQPHNLLKAKSGPDAGLVRPKEIANPADKPNLGPEPGTKLITAAAQVKSGAQCLDCHDVRSLLDQKRAGYWHFDRSHRAVLERHYDCLRCHAELSPFQAQSHTMNRLAQAETCALCHLATE